MRIRSIIFLVIVIALAYGGYEFFLNGEKKIETIVVKRGDIVQKVIVNGNTKPVNSVDLAFEINGTVSSSSVKIGSYVNSGQVLAVIDSGQLKADLLKAEANVRSERSQLAELKRGVRPEEVLIYQTEVDNASLNLADAESGMSNTLAESYTKSDDVIHNNIDQLFSSPKTSNPQFNFFIPDAQTKDTIIYSRIELESILDNWKLNPGEVTDESIKKAEINLNKINVFVNKVADAINIQSDLSSLPASTINTYKASVSTARSSITASIASLASAKEKLNTAKSTLILAQNNLSFKKLGNTSEAIKSQEAKVSQALASIESIQSQMSKTILKAPQAGTVTKQDAKVGQIVTMSTPIITIISQDDLDVEANVSEINIGKVMVGDSVSMKFDAFPGEVFTGVVTYIEPGETLVDGVVNYKVTIAFNEEYPNMKSGLTSKIEIVTEEKKSILTVPQYAVISNENGTFVSKQTSASFSQVPVTVGIRGQDGTVEIVAGVNEGDVLEIKVP